MLDHLHWKTFWRLQKEDFTYIVDVIKKGRKDRSLRNAIFQKMEPASLAVTGNKGKTSAPDKFHNHLNHVLIRKKSHLFAGKATVPDNVISHCQIDKYGTSLLFSLKGSSMFCFNKMI